VKKFAVAVLAMALLMLIFVMPVEAEPTKGLKVEAMTWQIGGGLVAPPEERWTTGGGVVQTRGIKNWYSNKLVIGEVTYDVHCRTVSDSVLNTKTGVAIMHMDAVWYIPSYGSPNGFAGNSEVKCYDFVDGMPPTMSSWSKHCVFQGFGTFAGQTLILYYEGPPGGIMTGYCLKG